MALQPVAGDPFSHDSIIDSAADENGIPRDLARALFAQESSFNPNAVNGETGAAGMGQLMPTTAEGLGVTDRFDPEQNIRGSLRYLKEGLDREGDARGALMYYYGGPDKGKWGEKTQAYPDSVLGRINPTARSSWNIPAEKAAVDTKVDTSGLEDVEFDPFNAQAAPTTSDLEEVDFDPFAEDTAAFGFHPQLQRSRAPSVTDSLPEGAPLSSGPLAPPPRETLPNPVAEEIAARAAQAKALRIAAERPVLDTTGMTSQDAAAAQQMADMGVSQALDVSAVAAQPRPGPTIEAASAMRPQSEARASNFDFEAVRFLDKAPFVTRLQAQMGNAVAKQAVGLGVLWKSQHGTPDEYASILDTYRDLKGTSDVLGTRAVREPPQGAMQAVASKSQEYAEQIVASMATSAPVVGFAIMGAPAAGLALMGLGVMGDEYANGVTENMDPWDALKRGGVYFGAEVLGEMIGLPSFSKLLKGALNAKTTGRELVELAYKHLGKEVVGEEFTTTAEFLVDKLAPYGLTPDATLGDYLQQVIDTAVVTVGQTALMGGAGAVVNKAIRKWSPDSEQAQAMDYQDAVKAADAARDTAMGKWATSGLSRPNPEQGGAVPAPSEAAQEAQPEAEPPAGAVPGLPEVGTNAPNEGVAVQSPAMSMDGGQAPRVDAPPDLPRALSEEEADRQIATMARTDREDQARVKFTPTTPAQERVEGSEEFVEAAKDMRAAVKMANGLTKETGEKHRAVIRGGMWLVVKEKSDAGQVASDSGVDAPAVATGEETTGSAVEAVPDTVATKSEPAVDETRPVQEDAPVAPEITLPAPANRSDAPVADEATNVAQKATEEPDAPALENAAVPAPEAQEAKAEEVATDLTRFGKYDVVPPPAARAILEKAGYSFKPSKSKGFLDYTIQVKGGEKNGTVSANGLPRDQLEGMLKSASEPIPDLAALNGLIRKPAPESGTQIAPPAAQPAFKDFTAPRTAGKIIKGEVRTFKTAENAARFAGQRVHGVPRGYVPRETPDGWVLSKPVVERTPAQKANDQALKDRATKVLADDNVGAILAKSGGMNMAALEAEGADAKDVQRWNKIHRNAAAHRGKGLSIDGAAEVLAEQGFDVHDESGAIDASKAWGLIHQEILGEKVYSPEGSVMRREADAARRAKFEAETPRAELNQSGYNGLSDEGKAIAAEVVEQAQEPDDIPVLLDDPNARSAKDMTDEDIDALFGPAPAEDEGIPVEGEAVGAVEDSQGRADAGEAQGQVVAPVSAPAETPPANESRPALDLTGQSEQEIQADAARAKQSADEKAKRENAPASDGFVLAGSSRMVDEAEARGQKPMLFSRAPDAPVSLGEFWQSYAQDPDAFLYDKSDATDIDQIAEDYKADPEKWRVEAAQRSQRVPGAFDPEMVPVINIDAVDEGGAFRRYLEVHPDPAGDPEAVFIRINETGSWPRRMDGALAYQMAMAWAVNNGLKVNPDTDLLPVNRLRRTEAMISTMLKYGQKAGQIRPHAEQFIGLLDPADWNAVEKDGMDGGSATFPASVKRTMEKLRSTLWTNPEAGRTAAEKSDIFRSNLENLLIASSELARRRVPDLNDLRIRDDGTIENTATLQRAKVRRDTDLGEVGIPSDPGKSGVGSTTGLRVVATLSVQRGAHPTASGILEELVGKQRLPDAEGGTRVLAQSLGRGLQVDPGQARILAQALGEGALYSRAKPTESRHTVADETQAYTHDILGRALPAAEGGPDSGKSKQAPAGGNVDAAGALSPERYAQEVRPVTTGHVAVGVERVRSAADAAHVFAALRRDYRELFAALVLDKDDRPISYLPLFAGGISSTSVSPEILAAEVYATPGARKVWVAHNHPSGEPTPSFQDVRLTTSLDELFGKDLGVELTGHVVISGNKFANVSRGGENPDNQHYAIPPKSRKHSVPIVTRRMVKLDLAMNVAKSVGKISSPDTAKTVVPLLLGGVTGAVYVDAQSRPIAIVPTRLEDMIELRKSPDRFQKAVTPVVKSGAQAVFFYISQEDDLSTPKAADAARNLATALSKVLNVRVLDILVQDTSGRPRSHAERGEAMTGDTFYRRGDQQEGLSLAAGRKAVADVFGEPAVSAMEKTGLLTFTASEWEWPSQWHPRMEGGERGVYHKGRAWIATGTHETAAELVSTVLHEIGEHHGAKAMLGEKRYAQMAQWVKNQRLVSPAVKAAWADVKRTETYAEGSEPFMSEVIARVGQDQDVQKMSSWRQMIDAVRAFLIKHYAIPTGNLTEEHIKVVLRAALARSAREAVAQRKEGEKARERGAKVLASALEAAPQFSPDVGAATKFSRAPQTDTPVGTFDASNPDIRFARRSTAEPAEPESSISRIGKIRDADRTIRERVVDLVRSDKGFNLWHTTVGTQYHKAYALDPDGGFANPDFKRVYDAGQDYLREMSRAALEAADQAPAILPKMEGLRGAAKSIFGAASQKDIAAASSALLDGTLADPSGDPHKGKVYADVELRAKGLDDRQIDLYRQARNAIDLSLDLLLASEVARMVRKMGVPPEVFTLMRQNPGDSGYIVGDELARQAAELDSRQSELLSGSGHGKEILDLEARKRVLIDMATDLAEKQDTMTSLKTHGYAPLMRFGKFTVTAYDVSDRQNPKTIYHSMHERQSEANAVKREVEKWAAEQGYPTSVESGIRSEQGFMLYRGLTPDTLELFAHTLSMDGDAVFQQYLRSALNTRSAMKRMIHRKGVSGFEEELPRILASFITSNSRAVAGNWHMGELVEAADAIKRGDVNDEAVKLVNYLQNPGEEAAALRSYLFINYLGGSVASAMVNMTQPLTMTFPYLSQWGAKRAVVELTRAMVEVPTGVTLEPGLAAAMKRGEEEGIVAPHEIHQLHAEAMHNMGSNIWWRRTITAWGALFSAAESFNRRATFIAAYRVAQADSVADPYAFARRAVEETQGVYNRGNRPNWSRGAIGATLMTFKQFSISYVEFLKRLPPRERALALLVIFMLAGVKGLPFFDDAEDILDTIAQQMGYSFNSRQALRNFLVGRLGQFWGGAALHGVSGVPGAPIDVQGRLGMGNLIPGTSIFKQSADTAREIADVLGPAGGLAQAVVDFAKSPDKLHASKRALPTAVQNVEKAVEMWQTGAYKDTQGRRVKDVTKGEALAKGIGFMPQRVAEESRRVGEQMQNINLHKKREDAIADRWARALFDRGKATSAEQRADAEQRVEGAKADLADWNRKNPEARIVIKPAQLHGRMREMQAARNQRIIKRAPPEMRREVRDALSEGE